MNRAVELCFLENVLHQTIDTLSKGYKHRTCLAQSLIHDPDVLILDEPTDGLDPNQKHEVRNLIKRMGAEQGHRFLHPHPGRGRGGVLARDHHRPRPDRGERHARRAQGALGNGRRGACARARPARRHALRAARAGARREARGNHQGSRRARRSAGLSDKAASATLTRSVAELAAREGWQLDEIHTEEGRLDEVFRTITLPDTVKAAA